MKKTYTAECPHCGRNSLVQRNENLYQCLSCNFRKDFSFPDIGKTIIAFIAVILMAFLAKYAYGFADEEPNNNVLNSQQLVPKSR